MRLLKFGLAFLLATAVYADIITLKSGRVINGTYLGGTAREVKVEIGDQVETFDVSQIARIEFGSGGSASPGAPADRPTLRRAAGAPPPDDDRPTLRRSDPATPPDDRPTLRRSDPATPPDDRPTLRRSDAAAPPDDRPTLRRSDATDQDAPRQAAIMRPGDSEPTAATTAANVNQPAPTELPAGTSLVVRMIEAVDSDKTTVGQSFRASLVNEVNFPGTGLVAFPRGSDVVVKLVNAKESGRLAGKAELTLSLWSVKVGDRIVDVDTQTVTRESESRGTKTGTMAGGGAIVGAVIGGLAGGGRGAAIGAAAGAGAGLGAEAATKGQKVKIPSETELTFVLDNPVRL
jgi:hypothetical protein